MAKKYYVVWKGRKTGIFTDWATCKSHVDGFNGARYKSFKTKEEAQLAFEGKSNSGSSATPTKKTAASKNSVKTYTAKEIIALQSDVTIFTDGGCDPNPGRSGSGIAVYHHNQLAELWYGLYHPQGTNNTAELNALNQALIMAKSAILSSKSVSICCDSKYSIQCITQWAANWKKNGWKKSGGEIKNLALIQEMFARYTEIKDKVAILHVNGHVGVEGNELADRMSIHAIKSQDAGFHRYADTMDVNTILAMTSG
ncbi:ribonuclease HI [Vibrio sp. 10N.286.49.B3]|uniref:ribonuclease H family protein n=1 Tax=Vibrio sp. 10N.286.49.B3 TaxID=1880855 RepID=UPI000C8167F6|nr:ribonuclease H family protein [Vibrio sp. 10N.286.49.B3]PMH43140.1 ribonuclease HI [Vibrio sp. 10N.286.49.B3]